MNDSGRYWPGAFGGLRVPFEPKIIFLGLIAVLFFMGGVELIHIFSEETNLISRSFFSLAAFLGPTAVKGFLAIYDIVPGVKISQELLTTTPSTSAISAVVIWSLLVWSLFGGAMNRLAAYCVAKEEAIPVSKAMKFAWKRKTSLLFTPFAVVILISFFYGCNLLAGYLAQVIPVAGPIIFIPVFFLVMISTFLILVFLITVFFGFHMIASVIGAEGCDGMEAFIGVLNFIFSRPWSYIFYHLFMVLSLGIIVWFGGIFIDISFESSLVSADKGITNYRFEKTWDSVTVIRKDHQDKTYLTDQKKFAQLKEQNLEGELYQSGMHDVWAYIQEVPVESWMYSSQENDTDRQITKMQLKHLWHLDKFWACIAGALALFYFVLQCGVWGYALAYVCCASTTIYFVMRKEIEGADFEELWEEDMDHLPLGIQEENPEQPAATETQENTNATEKDESKQKVSSETTTQDTKDSEADAQKSESEEQKSEEQKPEADAQKSESEEQESEEQESEEATSEKQDNTPDVEEEDLEENSSDSKDENSNDSKDEEDSDDEISRDEDSEKEQNSKGDTGARRRSRSKDMMNSMDSGTMSIPLVKRNRRDDEESDSKEDKEENKKDFMD